MLKLILKVPLVFCLSRWPNSNPFLLRNYSATSELANEALNKNLSPRLSEKTLNSLSPIKIYTNLNHPTKKIKMLNDLTGEGGIVLFLSKKTSLYAIEGSCNLTGYLKDFFNKEMLKLLADIKLPKAIQKKTKIQLKTHYQELLHQDWKDYDLYLLESWKTSEDVNIKHRLVSYHTKYQPKLNLFRYVSLANGEIEEVYQWNRFKTEEEMLAKSQKKAAIKPLLTSRIDSKSPLDKLKAKVWYENKNKVGIYRWVNRDTKQSYVGSTLNLGSILYSLQLDKSTTNSKDYLLNQAFQEYGLTNFTLQILAYCNKEELTEKERYYFQLYHPEYNLPPKDNKKDQSVIDNSLAKLPTSIIEYNAFAKQLVLFQPPNQQLTSINPSPSLSLIPWKVKPVHLPIIPNKKSSFEVKTKKWTLSEATRLKQSLAQQKRTKHPKVGLAVQVLDLVENKTTVYSSLREAARALNIRDIRISEYFNREQSKPYKKRYVFTKV